MKQVPSCYLSQVHMYTHPPLWWIQHGVELLLLVMVGFMGTTNSTTTRVSFFLDLLQPVIKKGSNWPSCKLTTPSTTKAHISQVGPWARPRCFWGPARIPKAVGLGAKCCAITLQARSTTPLVLSLFCHHHSRTVLEMGWAQWWTRIRCSHWAWACMIITAWRPWIRFWAWMGVTTILRRCIT